jgi:predicted AlkP superfamily phosphohydrolase/phosphomutase
VSQVQRASTIHRKRSGRVFVVALDGAPPDLLFHWASEGRLPVLQKLIREGCAGRLTSSIPWATPSAWASFATGMNPGKHGVYDFWIHNDAELRPANRASIQAKTLWRHLSERGRRVGVVNVPMTCPAEEVNGFLVGGIPYLCERIHLSHPPELIDELKAEGWDLTLNASDYVPGSYDGLSRFLLDLVRARVQATLYLMREYAWDFLMVHFLETDQAGHRFMSLMTESGGSHPRYRHYLLQFYQQAERAILPLIEELREDTTLILVSDHGLGPRRHIVSFNNWLLENGYLYLKNTFPTTCRRLLRDVACQLGDLRSALSPDLRLLGTHLTRRVLRSITRPRNSSVNTGRMSLGAPDWLVNQVLLTLADVDWARTSAYAVDNACTGAIYVNLRGRQSRGIVEPGREYEALRLEIARKVRRLIDPETGKEIVACVAKGEEVYHGPCTARGPDLLVFFSNLDYESERFGALLSDSRTVRRIRNWTFAGHRPDGILVMRGPRVRKGLLVGTARIEDVAPTILQLLAEPIPADMDGSALQTYLSHEVMQQGRVERLRTASNEKAEALVDETETAKMLEQLKALGYLD